MDFSTSSASLGSGTTDQLEESGSDETPGLGGGFEGRGGSEQVSLVTASEE